MKPLVKRLRIYPSDIVKIEGISERQARNVLKDIKERYQKEKHQFVSVKEYSLDRDLSLEEIENIIFC